MRRRDFLRVSAGAAVGAVISPPPLWSQATPTPLPPSTGSSRFDDNTRRKIEQLLPPLMREKAVPAVAIGIVDDGRLAWQRAFGVKDATTQEPADERTVFEVASVSKTVFAYAALKLCERGTLGLDTPLTHYSKKRFSAQDARIERVTPRHALSHTTGLPEWRTTPAPTLETNPGERFRYSGEGYYYLQSVISEVAGQTFPAPCGRYEADLEVCATDFDAFMGRSLLEPLGMSSSGYVWREHFVKHGARPHDIKGQPLPTRQPNAADIARYGAVGGLRTTVSDYARFLLAVLNVPAGDAFLSGAMRDEMLRPQVKLDPSVKIDGADSWALGWAVQQRPTGHVILHSGGQAGFRSLVMASPTRKSGFMIFTNSDSGGYICDDPALHTLLTPLLAG